ncbi:MAG: endopeptidase La [Polyangiaceae bacterium]
MAKLRGGARAPESPFAVLPLRTGVIFPGTRITLPVGRERSVALVQSLRPGDVVGVALQREPATLDPAESDLHEEGTFARVHQVARVGTAEYRVVLEGLGRMRLSGLTRTDPFWQAHGEVVEEEVSDEREARLLAKALRDHLREMSAGGEALAEVAASEEEPGIVADQVASGLELGRERQLEALRATEVVARLRLVTGWLTEAKAAHDVKRKIDSDVRKGIGKAQKEALLREQMKAIQNELGDGDDKGELDALEERLDNAGLTDEARAVADRELRRLKGMPPQGAEHHVIRTYLETIADLPWSARAETKDDLDGVARKLDEDHAGLVDIKKRILEQLAVLQVSRNPRGTILCFVGPPGVGKTSLGQSIADATGRPFARIALGGVRDEAEIRGHRRTYVGALPGRIINTLKKVKAKNPVLLLDEIDKLFAGWSGSPEAALLEVLDPEQNKTFTDHYLEIPFDLSEVMFLVTANTLETLSAPLRDRLEIIELSGYTREEKVAIARSHLVPKRLKEFGLDPERFSISDAALSAIVSSWTREAGVRQLTRQLDKLCRAFALETATARQKGEEKLSLSVEVADLVKYLGKVRFHDDVAERTSVPGVATGLAWTPVGGDILFVETSRMPGKGRMEITGQLGDVMKESARAALTYVRSNAALLGVDPQFLESQDVHVHVPAGAVPKDGPSAGVTMFTALTSLLTGRKVRSDTAMTGEVTLRGRVLPVGGIKAKVLAAHRAGITRVILPQKNAPDVEEVPKEAREAMEFVFVDDMSELLPAALEAEVAPVVSNDTLGAVIGDGSGPAQAA